MRTLVVLLTTLAATTLPAGCLDSAVESTVPTLAPAPGADEPQVHATEWKGYLRAGPADQFAHTKETEAVVQPLATMGFNLKVPNGTTNLRFKLDWQAGPKMHLMVHAPHEGSAMPTYMGPTNGSGSMCFLVPADEIREGVWKVMAHGEPTAVNLEFKITARSEGPAAPAVQAGLHGHASDEEMDMPMRPTLPC